MSSNGTLSMAEARESAASALAPASPTDPQVYPAFADAIDPPAVWLSWAAPWVEPAPGPTVQVCTWQAHLTVQLFAARLEPGEGVAALERLWEYTEARLRAAGLTWPLEASRPPGKTEVGGVTYLTATLQYRVPVTAGGGE